MAALKKAAHTAETRSNGFYAISCCFGASVISCCVGPAPSFGLGVQQNIVNQHPRQHAMAQLGPTPSCEATAHGGQQHLNAGLISTFWASAMVGYVSARFASL